MMYWTNVTDWAEETQKRVSLAEGYFKNGYNCSQAVAMSFADVYQVPPALMSRLSASFGGGIGRMREVCGAVCGMCILIGLEIPDATDSPMEDIEANVFTPYPDAGVKKKNYEVVQRLADEFKRETGSVICADLLGLNQNRKENDSAAMEITPVPEPRTALYYKKRPCVQMVEIAVKVFMQYVKGKYEKKI